MNALLRKETPFLKLLLVTISKQQKALIKTITPSQMKAIVQIVYNVLQGNRSISTKHKNKLMRHKRAIRRFIARGLGHKQRVKVLLKHLKSILSLLKVIEKEL